MLERTVLIAVSHQSHILTEEEIFIFSSLSCKKEKKYWNNTWGKFVLDVLNNAHCFPLQGSCCLASLNQLIYCESNSYILWSQRQLITGDISVQWRTRTFKCVTLKQPCIDTVAEQFTRAKSGEYLCDHVWKIAYLSPSNCKSKAELF